MKNQKTTLKIGSTTWMAFYISSTHPFIHHCITLTPPIAAYVHSDSPTPDEMPTNSQQEDDGSKSYSIIPWSDSAIEADCKLGKVQTWLETPEQPEGLSDSEYKTFMRYCTEFVIISNWLWHKNPQGNHKMVVPCIQQLFLITSAVITSNNYQITACPCVWYWASYQLSTVVYLVLGSIWMPSECH